MSLSAVHQLVHGYEHGHSLLAASVQLERDDLDLIGRLSDLSGALGPDLKISPYLSMYPLPSGRFFAVARTWPDDSAPRSGCVLTHTILVPLEVWAADSSPNRFAAALRAPDRNTLGSFTGPLTSVPTGQRNVTTSEPLGDFFVQRYFGEGLAPIVWMGAFDPESAAWCVIQALWPSLRTRFACCTLAFQPRTLGDRPFDLVFAPPAAFSRFAEFARDHVVDARAFSNTASADIWLHSWSKCIFEGNPHEICEKVHVLASSLEPHPAAIRSVLFFLDLQSRAEGSPTAALGALDLLDKLAPQPERAEKEKSALTATALRSIKKLPAGDALELLYLLCGRLQEHSLLLGQGLYEEVRNQVQLLFRDNPEQGITDTNSLIARQPEAAPSLFMLGVGDATMKMLGSNPNAVSLLLGNPTLAERLIPYRPEIPFTMLRSSSASEREQVASSIADWCRVERSTSVRQVLRRSLLPEVTKPSDAPLLEELLRDLGPEDVAEVCEIIGSRDAFRLEPLLGILSRFVGERHPDIVRRWSKTHSWNSYAVATVVAASYPGTPEGLNELLATRTPKSANDSFLLTAFIVRVSRFSPPDWLLSVLETDLRCWELLLTGIKYQTGSEVVISLVRGGLKRSPIARVPDVAEKLGEVSGRDSDKLKEHAVRQLLADYLEGLCDIERVKLWFEKSWVIEILNYIRPDSITTIFTDRLDSSSSWQRAWDVVENIPGVVSFENEFLIRGVISALLHADLPQWTTAAANSWQRLLSSVAWGERVQLGLCGQALHFALEHRQLPLAAVVAETFYPVHEAAMGRQHGKENWSLWRFVGWDKASELRRSLVDSFIRSEWPPFYFVLSAREPWLLRKLCRRMLRQWGGFQYIESAYAGIRSLPAPKARELENVLRQIVQNPEIDEKWD